MEEKIDFWKLVFNDLAGSESESWGFTETSSNKSKGANLYVRTKTFPNLVFIINKQCGYIGLNSVVELPEKTLKEIKMYTEKTERKNLERRIKSYEDKISELKEILKLKSK